jgi:DNA ligase-associated metallophosphoesterase
MDALTASQVFVAENVLLDGRLALFHEREKWLAIADVHFGYELSQRAAGNLFPLWGMQSIELRLHELLTDYAPQHLILLGDLVHDRAGANNLFALLERLQAICDVVLIAGNHDRHIKHQTSEIKHLMVDSWETEQFYFHHGHCAEKKSDRIQIIGHHHPAGTLRDGAGLHLKLPAFVQQPHCWIMPAFSPWAGGTVWVDDGESKIWLCSPKRILLAESNGAAA